MAKLNKTMVDKELRDRIFKWICSDEDTFTKINDRQYGAILTDLNGIQRYVRIGAIVAELREDMTAEELMTSEIEAYHTKQAEKEEKAKAKASKIAKSKAKKEEQKDE